MIRNMSLVLAGVLALACGGLALPAAHADSGAVVAKVLAFDKAGTPLPKRGTIAFEPLLVCRRLGVLSQAAMAAFSCSSP